MEKRTQQERLIIFLEKYQYIDPITAWKQLGIYRLSARINMLRNAGVNIETERITVYNSFNEACSVAKYRLL